MINLWARSAQRAPARGFARAITERATLRIEFPSKLLTKNHVSVNTLLATPAGAVQLGPEPRQRRAKQGDAECRGQRDPAGYRRRRAKGVWRR